MDGKTDAGPIGTWTKVRFQDPLPDAADVVVVGGGVIGIFAALFLNRTGLKVVVCEKGRVAGEQSSRNWGWVRKQGRDPAELPVMLEADRLWDAIDEQVGGRTGLTRKGIFYLASSEKEQERNLEWIEVAKMHQVDTRALSSADIATLIDQTGAKPTHRWVGGIMTASDGRAEPWEAVPAVAELAHSEGVIIREDCAARALDIEGGRITGLTTEAGSIRTGQVVVAAGAWSSLFARRHGVDIPQLSVRASVARTVTLPNVCNGNAADERLAIRRRTDGGYTLAPSDFHEHFLGPDSFRNFFKYLPVFGESISDTRVRPAAPKDYPDAWSTNRRWSEDEISPFERMRVLDPKPDERVIARLRRRFAERFPAIGEPEIANSWAGMIDSMPDVVPVVDRVSSPDGLVLATGMSGHGFGIGPGFGKVVADIVTGKPTGHDLTRFRFSRFSDGSRMEIGPAL